MKTVFDLSRDEIVALTDEEMSLYIDKELVGKGKSRLSEKSLTCLYRTNQKSSN